MKIAVYKKTGGKAEDINLSAAFATEVSPKTITQYINYVRAALQAPIANTKNRGEVRGGGKKPWRQKGTGNARVGSSRSPLWSGGGITFGPTSERNFSKRINAGVRRKVILGIFSEFIKDKQVKVVEDFNLPEPKTKQAEKILENLKAEGKISVILSGSDTNASLAIRNLAGVKSMTSGWLDILYLISSNQIVLSKNAITEIENTYAKSKSRACLIKKEDKEPVKDQPEAKVDRTKSKSVKKKAVLDE